MSTLETPAWCFHDVDSTIYILWIILIISAVATPIFNMFTIYKVLNLKRNQSEMSLSVTCISVVVSFAASGATYIVHTGQSIFCSEPLSWTISGCIAIACYMCALSLLYILYLLRLKFIFQNTHYFVSTLSLFCFFMGFIIQIFCIFVATLYLLKNDLTIGLKAYSAFNTSNFICNTVLILLFIRKMYILGTQIIKSNPDQSASFITNNTKSKEVDEAMRSLVSPTIRYVICAFISLLSSNLLSAFGILRSGIVDTQFLRMLHILLIVMDQGVNSYFLFLQYSFGDAQYLKRCQHVHNYVLSCFKLHERDKAHGAETVSTLSTNDVTTSMQTSIQTATATKSTETITAISVE